MAIQSTPIVMEEVTDPVELAQARAQRALRPQLGLVPGARRGGLHTLPR